MSDKPSADQRRQELLNAALGGPGKLGNQVFPLLGVRIKNGRVTSSFGKQDHGPLRGAHAEVIAGKPAPQHGLVYSIVVGFSSSHGPTTVLITFADGSYVERKIRTAHMTENQARDVAEAGAEVARFNQLAAMA
jgi:hypothetical protein